MAWTQNVTKQNKHTVTVWHCTVCQMWSIGLTCHAVIHIRACHVVKKANIALHGNLISELRDVTCHMLLQCTHTTQYHLTYSTKIFLVPITQCYLPSDTSEGAPRNPSHTGWYSIYLPWRDGRLSWPSWLDSPMPNCCTTKTTRWLECKCSECMLVCRSAVLQSRTLWLLSVLMTDAVARTQVCLSVCLSFNKFTSVFMSCQSDVNYSTTYYVLGRLMFLLLLLFYSVSAMTEIQTCCLY